MKGLFIINPSSGKQNIDSMLREIMATLILDQICSHVDVFYTKGKDDAKNRAAELKPGDYDFVVSVGVSSAISSRSFSCSSCSSFWVLSLSSGCLAR